jgi:hypothetical protein
MKNLTVATIEDTDITMLWGDNRAFVGRVTEYGQRTGARVGFVFMLENMTPDDEKARDCF